MTDLATRGTTSVAAVHFKFELVPCGAPTVGGACIDVADSVLRGDLADDDWFRAGHGLDAGPAPHA